MATILGIAYTQSGTSAYVSGFVATNILVSSTIQSSVYIGGNSYPVTSIGGGAFYGSPFRSITIPNSVTSILDDAFGSCESLTSIDIPNSVTSIDHSAFIDCTSLTSVTIGNSVTSISRRVFKNCSSLTSVIIPNLVISIGESAFQQCNSLTSIYIPDSVTSIDTNAFASTDLTEIVIPNSVTFIGDSAFTNCLNLKTLTISENDNLELGGEGIFLNTIIVQIITDIDNNNSPLVQQITASSRSATVTFNVSCFNKGTKILCLNKNLEEEYIPIENLRKGYSVKSYKHGYRKIDLIGKNNMVNNPKLWHSCMYKMEKTKENGLLEDLIVTGGHSILVNNLGKYKAYNTKLLDSTLMIDDKFLLLSSVSKEFIKLENKNIYTYYHFTLENNGNDDERFGVCANGVLTETPSKKQFMKHNYTIIN